MRAAPRALCRLCSFIRTAPAPNARAQALARSHSACRCHMELSVVVLLCLLPISHSTYTAGLPCACAPNASGGLLPAREHAGHARPCRSAPRRCPAGPKLLMGPPCTAFPRTAEPHITFVEHQTPVDRAPASADTCSRRHPFRKRRRSQWRPLKRLWTSRCARQAPAARVESLLDATTLPSGPASPAGLEQAPQMLKSHPAPDPRDSAAPPLGAGGRPAALGWRRPC